MHSQPADAVVRARAEAQRVLAKSPSFVRMPPHEQLALYRSMVNDNLLRRGERVPGRARAFAGPLANVRRAAAPPPAGGLNPEELRNQRMDELASLGADFINEIDFPQFVKDLLTGVFDANLQVTLKQMETYQTLLKTASESLAKFVQKIDDAAAFAYLASNYGDMFSMGFDDESGEGAQPVLTDKEGNRLDLGDNEVKARIMDAKIAMAKEHRAMLRETILMGITRLVVEKGVVEAAVVFDVQAHERMERRGKAGTEFEATSATEESPSWFSGLFGSSDTTTRQTRNTRITVSSVKALTDNRLAAQIKGNVKIQFKSDYFKLDNFAALYQDGGDGGAPLGRIPGSAAVVGGGAGAGAAAVAR